MTEWNIPLLEIGDKKIKLVQGGMGLDISGKNLASAIANEGGLGNIAGVGQGELTGIFNQEIHARRSEIEGTSPENRDKIYDEIYASSNKQALKNEIGKARAMSNGKGMIGVNIMCALTDARTLLEAAIEAKADAVSFGAGIFRNFPEKLRGTETKILAIINSAKSVKFFGNQREQLGYFPSAFIVEGPKAGGHLGYSHKQLEDIDFVEHYLERVIPEVVETAKFYEDKFGIKIPVIAAGGIFYGGDIKKFHKLGASGVQIATRLVTTEECDAPIEFKQKYIYCNKEDLKIIHSPVGMPGRAITNEFLESVEKGEKVPYNCPYHCLITCNPKSSPYCIAQALLQAKKGNLKRGFAFAGSNAYLCKEIIPVQEVFNKLNQEYLEDKVSD